MFVWDELDDWVAIARHSLSATVDEIHLPTFPVDALTVVLSLGLIGLG